jgi:hypothetical protein
LYPFKGKLLVSQSEVGVAGVLILG